MKLAILIIFILVYYSYLVTCPKHHLGDENNHIFRTFGWEFGFLLKNTFLSIVYLNELLLMS